MFGIKFSNEFELRELYIKFAALLDEIIPLLEQYNYTFDLTDERQPYDLHFDKVTADSFAHVKWPEGHNNAGEQIQLRDHQVEVINPTSLRQEFRTSVKEMAKLYKIL